MKKETELSAAGRQYAEAYETHYTRKDLHAALQLYKRVVTAYPDSKEAEYSRTQIQNIVRDVVPKDVLHETLLNLALNYAKHNDEKNTGSVEVSSSVSAFST